MEVNFKIPFYAKIALISICISAGLFFMAVGRHIMIPVIYAAMAAILLNPLVNFLLKKGFNTIMAIFIIVVLASLLTLSIIYIISSQVAVFYETYPQLRAKFTAISNNSIYWVSEKFKIPETNVHLKLQEVQSEVMRNVEIGERLTEAGRAVMVGVLLPVYLFMILYYKPLLLEFIRKLFRVEHHIVVTEVLNNIKKIIHSYLVGLFFEMIIVAVLNSAGLLLLGIDYAILLGVIGAVINIIPYLGGIIAIALPMIIAFVTKDSVSYTVFVFLIYILIQFIDNHYLIPNIVASRVQLNALISVIIVLVGGALWGISGMFLSIPSTAIVKVIFDHIESLKPWGFLLGNTVPTASKYSIKWIKQSNSNPTKY